MADVTVKAYSELIHTPLYGQMRILREQKYPSQTDGQFRIPFYQPAIRAIRRYYQNGNNHAFLPANAASLTGCGAMQAKIDNNLRTLTAFRAGHQFTRNLTVQRPVTYDYTVHNVTIRATADVIAIEGASTVPKFIIYDCRVQCPEQEIIHTTVDLFHFVLEQNGMAIPVRNIEYVCLDGDVVHRFATRRATTIRRATITAAGIDAMWNSL